MKFDIIVGGVKTKFPEFEIRFLEEDNEIVVYFLKISKEEEEIIKNNIKHPNLNIENGFLNLNLKEIQYSIEIEGYETIIDFYENGGLLGFAFEDINGKLLEIKTPSFYK